MRNNIEDNITMSRAFQKAAYGKFILACYGHLFKENKYVCPLCAVVNVTTTREQCPSIAGVYMKFSRGSPYHIQ